MPNRKYTLYVGYWKLVSSGKQPPEAEEQNLWALRWCITSLSTAEQERRLERSTQKHKMGLQRVDREAELAEEAGIGMLIPCTRQVEEYLAHRRPRCGLNDHEATSLVALGLRCQSIESSSPPWQFLAQMSSLLLEKTTKTTKTRKL